jgi:hypothetical protein
MFKAFTRIKTTIIIEWCELIDVQDTNTDPTPR